MDLGNILGQEHLKEKIQSSIKNNNYPQSKIIIDRDGYGGLNFAIEIAKGLLRKSEFFKGDILDHPDLYFSFPTFVDKQTSQDLLSEWQSLLKKNIYINFNDWGDTSSNVQGKIRKAEIDSIHEKAHLKSFVGGVKVFILWDVQKLDGYSQNRLLKLLEEPPENTYFLMLSKSLDSLLPTIISRCQISSLKPVNFDDHKKYLQGAFKDIDYDLVTGSSRGSISRSISFINADSSTILYEESFIECLRFAFLAKKSKQAVLDLTDWSKNISSSSREQQKEFLSYCSFLIREAMLLSYKSPGLSSFVSSKDFNIDKLAPFIHSSNILEIIALIEDAHYAVSRNVNSKIVFTNFAIKLTKLINITED